MKRPIAIIVLLAISVCASAMEAPSGNSAFTNAFSGVMFRNIEEAFNVYIGSWTGSQSVSINGEEIMAAAVEQRYIPTEASALPKLVGSGQILVQGQSIDTRCYMYLDGDKLVLDIHTLNDKITRYIGILDGNTVVWRPLYMFLAYDIQNDSFFRADKGIEMSSVGLRYIDAPARNFKGMVETKTILQKPDASYSKDKANIFQGGSIFNTKGGALGN